MYVLHSPGRYYISKSNVIDFILYAYTVHTCLSVHSPNSLWSTLYKQMSGLHSQIPCWLSCCSHIKGISFSHAFALHTELSSHPPYSCFAYIFQADVALPNFQNLNIISCAALKGTNTQHSGHMGQNILN